MALAEFLQLDTQLAPVGGSHHTRPVYPNPPLEWVGNDTPQSSCTWHPSSGAFSLFSFAKIDFIILLSFHEASKTLQTAQTSSAELQGLKSYFQRYITGETQTIDE